MPALGGLNEKYGGWRYSYRQWLYLCAVKKTRNAVNLIIDIGNTVAKVAVFDGGNVVEVVYDSNRTLERLPEVCRRHTVEKAIVAAVIDLSGEVQAQLERLPVPLLRLDEKTPLPVENLYETPQTLGYDRMAAVVGAHEQFPGRDILVIDAGTCITYEFIDADSAITEGISPPACRCASGRSISLPGSCRW